MQDSDTQANHFSTGGMVTHKGHMHILITLFGSTSDYYGLQSNRDAQ